MKYFRWWVIFLGMAVIIGMLAAPPAYAVQFSDLKFGKNQFSDTQWNVSACTQTNTCQIYSLSGIGTSWNTGSPYTLSSTQYIQFTPSGNSSYPWTMKVYNSNGTVAANLGNGKLSVQGLSTDSSGKHFFFFMNANWNGTVFSTDYGFPNSNGFSFTGTLNPTVDQTNTFASTGSTEPLAAGQTYTAAPAAPSLCCGGSSASFSANTTNVAKVQAFVNRTTADSKVNIEQIGNANTTTIEQTGTKNNYVNYYVNGSSNTTTITQSGNASTQVNYVDLAVRGNSNTSTITQTSTGGSKGAFVSVNDNLNTLKIQQKDSGNHYAEVNLSGGGKNVDILQQGSAAHMTSVSLSGQPTSLTLTQSGSTQQFYSITHNCATAGGCAAITVTQGN